MSSTNRGSNRNPIVDFYPTPLYTLKSLTDHHFINYPVLEPCAGDLAIANELEKDGLVITNDNRLDTPTHYHENYLEWVPDINFKTIITNPPFSIAEEVITKALADVSNNGEVIMLLRLNFLGSQKRHNFWQRNTPQKIYVLSKRPKFTGNSSDSCEYAWFVWKKTYIGETVISVI